MELLQRGDGGQELKRGYGDVSVDGEAREAP